MGEAKLKRLAAQAKSKEGTEPSPPPVTIVTSEERVTFIRRDIDHLRRDFAFGDVRSVIIITAWCDHETGAQWHIESDDKPRLKQRLQQLLHLL